jgi:septum formation protein
MQLLSLSQLLGITTPIVLASASPRRKKLLEQIGLGFTVQPATLDEDALSATLLASGVAPNEYVQTLALRKAENVAAAQPAPALIIGADTTVVLDGTILNKPSDETDAARMLRALSGRTHTVFTGIALVEAAPNADHAAQMRHTHTVAATNVVFRVLDEQEITAYVATGSPLDKAGAYGIQDDFGAVFVERVEGCYYNVVGLPLEALVRTLKQFYPRPTV